MTDGVSLAGKTHVALRAIVHASSQSYFYQVWWRAVILWSYVWMRYNDIFLVAMLKLRVSLVRAPWRASWLRNRDMMFSQTQLPLLCWYQSGLMAYHRSDLDKLHASRGWFQLKYLRLALVPFDALNTCSVLFGLYHVFQNTLFA